MAFGCKLCSKPLAYPGAQFCGAACCAEWEAGKRPWQATRPLVVPGPCVTCGSAGHVWDGGEWVHGENTGTKRPCPRCAARTALAFLLVRIGSWTDARWDQHVRNEYGDDVADTLKALLADANIPVAEYGASKVKP